MVGNAKLLDYGRTDRRSWYTAWWGWLACRCVMVGLALAFLGAGLVLIAAGGHHEGEDVRAFGIILGYAALPIWWGGSLASIGGLIRRECRPVALTGLILNAALGVAFCHWDIFAIADLLEHVLKLLLR